jgi:hypothetical protein
MSAHFNTIERILLQLDQKYLDQVETYLEYLMFLQLKDNDSVDYSLMTHNSPNEEHERLQFIKQLKGDAPYPNVNISKYDVYEQ